MADSDLTLEELPGSLRDAVGNPIPLRGEIRVFLDDDLENRQPRKGFIRAVTAREVCMLLLTERVVELSLDHDLGELRMGPDANEDCDPDEAPAERIDPFKDIRFGTGKQVIDFLDEQQAAGSFLWPRDGITLHTSNTTGRDQMRRAMNSMERRHSGVEVRETTVENKPHFIVRRKPD